jgi:CubicO group peptidase (beta-lactamase class C family)
MNWTFPEIMQRTVLQPIRMQRSSYEQPLAASLAGNAAVAHHRDGMPYDGKWHVYPELAAAGLWTTPSDLAAWAIEIWNAYHGRSNRVIERSTAREMLERQFANHGLGPAMQGQGATLRFGHGGSNAGFNCVLTMYVEQGDGAAIMTNSDNGSRVFGPLLKAIAVEQRWPPD